MFAVTVTFTLKPDHMDAFLPLMQNQAGNSLEYEAGCHTFDVWSDGGDIVYLYEIYTSQAAFEVHLASDHFKSFDAAVATMIADKKVMTFGQKH